ncbi:MAG: hypothetical protein AB7G08_33545 [Hyphomicrobiaceae bacterium]
MMFTLFSRIAGLGLRRKVLPTPKQAEAGVLAPFNPALEDAAAKRFVYRRRGESDVSVANRWALAVCELLEETAAETAALDLELNQALAFTRGETPCGS